MLAKKLIGHCYVLLLEVCEMFLIVRLLPVSVVIPCPHCTTNSCALRRAKEEATRREVLARLQCTFTPRINRFGGEGAVSSRHGQSNGTTPSAASPRLVMNVAGGRSARPQTSESSLSTAHDRLYGAALLSRERLKAVVRSAEQARCSWACSRDVGRHVCLPCIRCTDGFWTAGCLRHVHQDSFMPQARNAAEEASLRAAAPFGARKYESKRSGHDRTAYISTAGAKQRNQASIQRQSTKADGGAPSNKMLFAGPCLGKQGFCML